MVNSAALNSVGEKGVFKILVGCKRVIDYAVQIRVRPDGSGVETLNVKHSINPFDEIAVEEALRIKEKLGNTPTGSDAAANTKTSSVEVVAISIGGAGCNETLKTALAMGVDRAIHIEDNSSTIKSSKLIAKILQAIAQRERPHLIILGKQAIDNDAGLVGPMLAGLLGWPQASCISKLELERPAPPKNLSPSDPLLGYEIKVAREVDWGIEKLQLKLPALVTTDLRLNQPRYATLQGIMKAKTKPIAKESISSLGINLATDPTLDGFTVLETTEPKARLAGVILNSVDELLDRLKNEAKII